jgi:hypothetical protein
MNDAGSAIGMLIFVLVGLVILGGVRYGLRRQSQASAERHDATQAQVAARAAGARRVSEAADNAAERGDLAGLLAAYREAEAANLSSEEFPAYRWTIKLEKL